jgi:hypothetical protein
MPRRRRVPGVPCRRPRAGVPQGDWRRPRSRLALMLGLAVLAAAGLADADQPMVGGGSVAAAGAPPSVASPAPSSDVERQVPFVLELRNTRSTLAEGVEAGVFLPVTAAVGQRCCRQLEASAPFKLLTDGAGNQAALFRIDRLAPHAVKVIRVMATVLLDPAGVPDADGDADHRPGRSAAGSASTLDPLLAATPLIQTQAPEVRRLAAELRGGSERDTAERIHARVRDHLTYSGYRRDARGALAALASGQGDCTEYMHLYSAIARAAGLPTRPMAGYVLGAGQHPRAAGLHNWAEVYADGRWLIADAQRGHFGDGDGRYLATRALVPAGAASGEAFAWPEDAVRFWADGDGIDARLQ